MYFKACLKTQCLFARRFEILVSSAVSKTLSAIMKLALMRTATGKETRLPLPQRISSLELTAPQIAAQINAS
jgi:hypothetical protein